MMWCWKSAPDSGISSYLIDFKCHNNSNAHPLITAPVSFHWLSQKVKVNQELISSELGTLSDIDLVRTNSLLSKQLDWLGNVSLEGLIELRKKGKLSELRTIINQDISSLSKIPLDDVEKVANQIDYNLSAALERHQEKIKELNSSYRSDLAVSLPTLAIAVTAALQPAFFPLITPWLGTAGGLVGSAKLKDVVTSTVKLIRERKALGRTPVGILWSAKKDQ